MPGHVTGSFAGGSHERYQGGGIHSSHSWSIDLAKLNPNCHYELFESFVTEIGILMHVLLQSNTNLIIQHFNITNFYFKTAIE